VPEPDISLHFLIQLFKSLNQAPKELFQRLTGARYSMPVGRHFLKQYNWLDATF